MSDRVARLLIAVGGIGTIVAVSLVCVFLLWVVVPLFLPATIETPQAISTSWNAQDLLTMGIDDYHLVGWMLSKQGDIRVFRLDNGQVLQTITADETKLTEITSIALALDGKSAMCGFHNGSVGLAKIDFNYQIISPDELPEKLRKLAIGAVESLDDGAIVTRTANGDLRRQKFALKLETPVEVADSSIARLDFVEHGGETRFCTLSADGKLRINLLSVTHNNLTDEDQSELTGAELPLPKSISAPPEHVLITELGDTVYAAWRDGRLLRYGTRNVEKPRLVEEVDLVPEAGHSLTALQFLLGRTTLVAGDTFGRVRGWFTRETVSSGLSTDENVPSDARELVMAQEFPAAGHAVSSIAASPRNRLAAVGFSNGSIRLLYLAARRTLGELHVNSDTPVGEIAIAPKGDSLIAATTAGITRCDFDVRHPEATFATLFLPVWYEGRQGPEHAWQSTGSSDASEAKLGLMPLVFGSLKATIFTMLFGAPLALLAAIYSSEFLHPRVKSRIKPTIEMMASLPSVVLGFLAGLVIAPFVEGIVPAVLTCIFTVPLSFLLGAYLSQLLPGDVAVRLSRYRLPFIVGMMPIGVFLGVELSPLVESWLFAGNIKEWLDGQRGSGIGGWVLLLLPLAGMVTTILFAQQVNPWLRRRSSDWTRTQAGLVELAKFFAGVACTIAVALAIAWLLDGLTLDPRGTFVGTYVQRNALVVGFAMGFAIIPLIYTIADDALSTVPEHLRSASLGTGATPWQTAVRIVIPTAASGLFSALMIGLGRAVGETMIVLMAAGNTPIMDWNIFNGFETLSMALATELPEAAKNSTHYRVLFLAAFTLFAITFVVNTFAEIVRQRFRRRAYDL